MKIYSRLQVLIIFLLVFAASHAYSQMQSDTSDAYWEVVMPLTASQDIDMGQVLVSEQKDSLVTGFIRNTGSWKFRVDSIYFRGSDASAFGMVSGFPKYEVAAGGNRACEFRFSPAQVGDHSAEIVIITQADTLVQNITGVGVRPQLAIIEDLIDFGQVSVGSQKDTLQAVTIKNIGTASLNISNTNHGKPNDVDFTTLAGGGAFTLQPGDTCKMDLRFEPSETGRTSGILEFHYNGVGSPAVVQLFGEGLFSGSATAELMTTNLKAYPGDDISIPIILNNRENLALSGAISLKTDLIYNSTILWAMDYPQEKVDDTTAKITLDNLPVNVAAGEPLTTVRFKAGLGNAEGCDLILSEAESDNGLVDISLLNGYFTLLGVCREGGTRLLNPSGKISMTLAPNPPKDVISVELNLIESGETTLTMRNSLGRIIEKKTLDPEAKFAQFDANGLPAGVYFITLRTPTYVETKRAVVAE